MINDLTSLKTKLETAYGDSIVVSNSKPAVLGHGEYPVDYDADIIKAGPKGIHIYPKENKLFRIELYSNDENSHVESDWDWFGITSDIVDDDIIHMVGELLHKTTAKDVYYYCIKHNKLTDRYVSPCVEVVHQTRKCNIDQFIHAADALITFTRSDKDAAIPPKYMARVILPLMCSIVEIIGRYATLCDNNIEPTIEEWHKPGKSKEYFKAGLPRIISFTLDDIEQTELYKNMRCGLVHAGEPIGHIKLGTYITTDVKNNTYNVYELWDLIKGRWTDICAMPTIHPTGGFAIIECQYGSNTNIKSI